MQCKYLSSRLFQGADVIPIIRFPKGPLLRNGSSFWMPPEPASLPVAGSTESFWLSEPSVILSGHRTTELPPTEADVAIIGSGMAGAFIAQSMFEDKRGRALNVTMYEAREVCSGASGRNGGHCQPLLYIKPPDVAAFEAKNFDFIRALIEKNGIPCEWQARPAVHAYYSEIELSQALQGLFNLQDVDPKLAEQCHLVTHQSKSPSLEDLRVPKALAAVVLNKAASLWPYKLVAWILEQILARNPTAQGSGDRNGFFSLQTNTKVTHIWQLPDKRWALKTDRGMAVAKHVVLATNGYTSSICPCMSDLIVPVRGEMSAIKPLAPLTSPLHRSYGFVGNTGKSDDGDYLIQRPNNGHLMYGGGRKLAPQSGIGFSDDSQIDEPAANYLRSELPHIMSLGEEEDCKLQITHQWTGILGFSRDGAPWVGEVPGKENANLWICAGYTGHGMPQAALSAYAVTKMLLQTVFDGKPLAEVHSSLIEAGDLPESFIISAERIARARELPQISEQQHKTHVEKLSALVEEHFSTVEELRQV
ncbi:hypothetical protein O988_05482 [Pseudogymnoascus sp. VKM F-3808]|nr:hypothetical protein O988_05482 [Pseudogymnoascus sp. VKM F-3808]